MGTFLIWIETMFKQKHKEYSAEAKQGLQILSKVAFFVISLVSIIAIGMFVGWKPALYELILLIVAMKQLW